MVSGLSAIAMESLQSTLDQIKLEVPEMQPPQRYKLSPLFVAVARLQKNQAMQSHILSQQFPAE